MSYEEILAGRVALPDRMQCSLNVFARRLAAEIDRELSKASPDNALVSVLCDAARLGWEHIESTKAGL